MQPAPRLKSKFRGFLDSKDGQFFIIALLISILLSGLLLYAMPCGPWAYSDSAAYLASARNLVEGKGLGYYYPDGDFAPLALHPPLYPLLLAGLVLLSVTPLQAAAALNILAFILWFTTAAVLLFRITGSRFFALLPCLVLVVHADFLSLFTGAMSESVFVWLSFSGLLLLVEGLQSGQVKEWTPAVIFLALAALTRYTGIAFIFTGAALILLFSQAGWRQRVVKAAAFGFFALLPLAIWLLLFSAPWGGIGGRTFSLPENGMLALQGYIAEFKGVTLPWLPYITRLTQFLSVDARLSLLVFASLVFSGVLYYFARKEGSGAEFMRTTRLALALQLCAIVYIAVHLSQYIYAFPKPDVIARILAPVLIAGIFYLFACIGSIRLFKGGRFNWIALLIAVAFALVIFIYQRPRTQEMLTRLHQEGDGFTAVIYCQTGLLRQLEQLPQESTLVSNQPSFTLLHINRMAEPYPLTNPSGAYAVLFLRQELELEFGTQQAEAILARHQSQCQTLYADAAGAIFSCPK